MTTFTYWVMGMPANMLPFVDPYLLDTHDAEY